MEASSACQAILGFPAEKAKGLAFNDLVVSEEQESLRRFFHDVLRGSASQIKVVRRRNPHNGLAALELICKAVPHSQTQEFEILGIARPAPSGETTTAVKDNLADSLAHELNQPLTALAIGAVLAVGWREQQTSTWKS